MGKRMTGPRIGSGPRMTAAQPAAPPTVATAATTGDRLPVGVREVALARVSPDPAQPRRTMAAAQLEELAASVATHGLLQPLVVREDGMGADGEMRYVVVAGGRRLAALRLLHERAATEDDRARWSRVVVVINGSEGAARRVVQLVENVQREALSAVEEGRALREIMDVDGLTAAQVAGRIHRSQGYVDERLRVVKYEEVADAVRAGLLTASAGAAVGSLHDDEIRAAWLARARRGEAVTARAVYRAKPAKAARPRRTTPTAAIPMAGNRPVEMGELRMLLERFRRIPDFTDADDADAYVYDLELLMRAVQALRERIEAGETDWP